MTFYSQKEEMKIILKNILQGLSFTHQASFEKNIAITWINYMSGADEKKGAGCGLNNNKQIYPASIVKLIYGLATYCWIQNNRILYGPEIKEAVFQMLSDSSNDATSFIVDILTGTTSGPSLEGDIWEQWQYQRQRINDWLGDFKWQELEGINCCQKTWEESPYGREKDFYGINKQNSNSITTDGTARIMQEIMRNKDFVENNINLKNCLFRELQKNSINNPNNQIEGFLGEGLPIGTPFWSKAGLMTKVRHDSAWWINDDNSKTLLVVFGDGEEFAKNKSFLPQIAEAIYKSTKRLSEMDIQ